MNFGSQTAQKEEMPTCFSKEWDPTEVMCTGGPDPKYTNPKTGQHVRPRCDLFHQCGLYTQAGRVASQQLIPTANLTRPVPQPMAPPPPAESTFQAYMQKQYANRATPQVVYPQQQQPQFPQMPVPMPMVPQQFQYPAPTYQLQYLVPGYLSVPEQRIEGDSYGSLLFRELLRSAGKALGHTFASFFDINPFRLPPRHGGSGQ